MGEPPDRTPEDQDSGHFGDQPEDQSDDSGIIDITIDRANDEVRVSYDPNTLHSDDADQLATSIAETANSSDSKCVFHVTRSGGRSCESCARVLECSVEEITGVVAADLSFRSGVLRIQYDESITSPGDLRHAVREIGIEASEHGEMVFDRSQLHRESVFVGITFIGMMFGLGGSWLGAPVIVVWISYGAAYLFGGWYGVHNAIETLHHRAVDIDLLMVLAALGALVIGAPFEGAMLLFLFSLSNVLQHYAIGRSRDAIRSLMKLRPDTATVLRDGDEVSTPIEEIDVGATILLRPGDRIPLDGHVITGSSTVDQSSLTGESVPVSKEAGDDVFAGTINEHGSLEVQVTKPAAESTLAKLIHMVEEAQSQKAPTQRLIDRLEQPYVLGVFGMTIIALLIPLYFGMPFDSTFYRAITLMVAASPCAVIISTPAAVLSAIASGARNGVLFKGGEFVEAAAEINVVALDKTGTLTAGESRLTDVGVLPDQSSRMVSTDAEVLSLAAAVQSRSEHHLAEATVDAARERDVSIPDAMDFHATVGLGVRAVVEDATIHIGNERYYHRFDDRTAIAGLEEGRAAIETLRKAGKTSVLVAREVDGRITVIGWLAFTDTIRPGATQLVADLRAHGVEHIVMLTGDNEYVANRIAAEVGIDAVQAELLPEQKVEAIESLIALHGGVAMVGDGINDAPALATATIGIGMGGAGTDVALETADIVLMSDEIQKIPYAIGLGRATHRKLVTNLGIAFGAIALMVGAILVRGIPLPVAVIGHEGSTVLVSLNGLRLLGYRP